MFVPEVRTSLIEACLEIGECYEMIFVEIGTDQDHVHYLIQTIPMNSPTRIATIVKSLTAKRLLAQYPWIKKMTLGSSLWTSGYYISTVGVHGNEKAIDTYVRNQGRKYNQLHRREVGLFDTLL